MIGPGSDTNDKCLKPTICKNNQPGRNQFKSFVIYESFVPDVERVAVRPSYPRHLRHYNVQCPIYRKETPTV